MRSFGTIDFIKVGLMLVACLFVLLGVHDLQDVTNSGWSTELFFALAAGFGISSIIV